MAAAAEGLCQEPIARVQHANQPRGTTRATRLRGGHGAATHPSTQLTRKRPVQLPSTSPPGPLPKTAQRRPGRHKNATVEAPSGSVAHANRRAYPSRGLRAGDRSCHIEDAVACARAALRYVAPWCPGAPSGSPGTRPCGQLLRSDGLAPHPNRSGNVIGSRMAGARRAAVRGGPSGLDAYLFRRADQIFGRALS